LPAEGRSDKTSGLKGLKHLDDEKGLDDDFLVISILSKALLSLEALGANENSLCDIIEVVVV
jgi:hypothetical protein